MTTRPPEPNRQDWKAKRLAHRLHGHARLLGAGSDRNHRARAMTLPRSIRARQNRPAGGGSKPRPRRCHHRDPTLRPSPPDTDEPAHSRGGGALCQPSGRCRGRRRLWPDPTESHSRHAAHGLPQSARLAAAALARRGADPARHHGGRSRNRRGGDAHGRRTLDTGPSRSKTASPSAPK